MAAAAASSLPLPSSSSKQRRVFVITGSNTGVGLAVARQLALGDDAGERHLILACRTPEKAQAAVDKIRAEINGTGSAAAASSNDKGTLVEWMQLDLTDYNSITRFVRDLTARGLPLHVLINNAGVNAAPVSLGQPLKCEHMFVANYLGAFLLTQQLLPLLESSAPSRIINMSSFMHRTGRTDFESQMRSCRTGIATYSSSKLAQIFHSYELQRRYAAKGISSFVTHPGACFSDIWNTLQPAWLRQAKPLFKLAFLTTEQGAAPCVHAATMAVGDGKSKDARGSIAQSLHFGPYRQPFGGWITALDAWQPSCLTRVTQSNTSTVTYDKEIAAQLWTLSEKLCAEWAEAAKPQ